MKKTLILIIYILSFYNCLTKDIVKDTAEIKNEDLDNVYFILYDGAKLEINDSKYKDWFCINIEYYINSDSVKGDNVLANALLYDKDGKIIGKMLKEDYCNGVLVNGKYKFNFNYGLINEKNIKNLFYYDTLNEKTLKKLEGNWISETYAEKIINLKSMKKSILNESIATISYFPKDSFGRKNRYIGLNYNFQTKYEIRIDSVDDNKIKCGNTEISFEGEDTICITLKNKIYKYKKYTPPYFTKLIEGSYKQNENSKIVKFYSNNKVENLKDFKEYYINFDFSWYQPRFDTITFINSQNKSIVYNYVYKEGIFSFYEVIPNENGEYNENSKIGDKIFELKEINK